MRALSKLLVVIAIALALDKSPDAPKPGPRPGPKPGKPPVRPPVKGYDSGVEAAWAAYEQGDAGGGNGPTNPTNPSGSGAWSQQQRDNMPNLGDTTQRRSHSLYGEYGPGNELISGAHAHGQGGGTEFPRGWPPDYIIDGIEDVARNPQQVVKERPGGGWIVRGNTNGIEVEVVLNRDGTVWTGYPLPTADNVNQGVVVNDRGLLN